MGDRDVVAAEGTVLPFDPAPDDFRTEEEDEEEGEDYRKLAQELLGETEDGREEAITELRRRLDEEGYRVPIRRAFLIKFVRAGNFSVEGALKFLTNYVGLLRDFPLWSVDEGETRGVASQLMHTVLRHRDKYGRRVHVFRSGMWDPEQFTFDQCYKFGFMLNELVALEGKTQVAGVTIIIDQSGFGFHHFRHLTIGDVRNAARFIQESFPVCFRAFHVINVSYAVDVAYHSVVRPLLSSSLRDRIHFHGDLQSLHAHVDKQILPEELGGEDGPLSNEDGLEALISLRPYFGELANLSTSPANS